MGNVKWIELLGWLLLWITCRLALATGWFTIPSLILLVTVPLRSWYLYMYLIFPRCGVILPERACVAKDSDGQQMPICR